MSAGTYSQNFNSLAISGTANPWTDNSTLPGWYASKTIGGTTVTTYRGDDGSSTAGAIYSFGTSGSTERALGSIASGTPGNFAYGIRFTNDTGAMQTNFLVSYTGEQWRNGGAASASVLAFSYRISNTAITNSDASNASTWTGFSALNFTTPTFSATSGALDGNAAANRQVFTNIVLTGATVLPGQEIFLRWFDTDDSGFDHGVALDNLTIALQSVTNSPPTNSPPVITTQPQSQIATQGDTVTFTVSVTGYPPPWYQWKFNTTNLVNETNASLALYFVTTNHAGDYSVTITNIFGSTNSAPATLTVNPLPPATVAFSLITYNTAGFGTSDRSTNAPQVQAIGRQLIYLKPDIVTFQEVTYTNTFEMVNWVIAYLPGYYLATNSATDGILRSAIASRFPITRSTSWLPHADLNPFGYTNSNFTRDLFEAQISVPGFPQPLHVFTVHLKSGQATDESNKRSAEAGAISNFFVNGFLTTNSLHPYVLTGDMNEDIARPPSSNPLSMQKLLSAPVGLQLTTPLNPVTHSELTHNIQSGLVKRYDYILPNALLLANVATSQVFRTDMLNPLPPNLNANDDFVASDHLPVLMVFNNPYSKPFQLTSITRSNPAVTLKWESVIGQPYRVEASTNLTAWSTLSSNVVATGTNYTFSTNLNDDARFFRVNRVP